jgi:chromosome partitioning protein
VKVIAFSSIKGGTGKSSLAILTANYCAAAGARVLMVDLDIQNSASFYYLDDFSAVDRHNVALALNSGKIAENILPSNYMGIDILPAHFALVNLRTLGERTLKRQIAETALPYDFAFVDCAPTYDNLVLNALNAADLILTPVRFSQFDYKGAVFYRDQIEKDTDRLPAWHILFNFYRPPRTENAEALGNQYESTFRETFDKAILPFMIPDSSLVQRAVDTRTRITEATAKVKLFDAIKELAGYIGADGTSAGF